MDEILKKKLDKDAFDAIVAEYSTSILILGPEESDCYWELDLAGVAFAQKRILIRNPDYGIEPEAYILKDKLIGVGVNSTFYLLYENGKIKEIDLPFLFHTILWADTERILIRYEIGFIGISIDDGMVIWEQNTDLLSDYQMEDGKIRYETFEGDKGEIDVPFLSR